MRSGRAATAPPPAAAALASAVAQARADGRDPAGLLWVAISTALLDLPVTSGAGGGLSHRGPRTLLAALSSRRGSDARLVGDVLFVYEGANPRATLAPIIDRMAADPASGGVPRSAPVGARPAVGDLAAGLRAARAAVAAVRERLEGEVPDALVVSLQAAVRATARARNLLDTTTPRLVVVASQHSTASRGAILAARDRSIATAYLAHAPVADTYQYRDLPTDFAGVRGAREVAFYRGIGAARDPEVIGNPSIEVRAPARLDPDLPVVFAPRPQPPDVVRAQVALVTHAADEVVVSPHPRMQEDRYDQLWPAHWAQHRGRTAELFRAGHPCTIQQSSGVAWESLAHGIPVVDLGTGPAAYPVIREPYVARCDTGQQLADAVDAARRAAADESSRSGLMDWAHEWCAASGTEAVERAVRWIEACRGQADQPPGPVLDAWAPQASHP